MANVKSESTEKKIDGKFLKFMADLEMSEAGLTRLIENLDISADAKSLLLSFSKATIKTGGYVFKIGRKIIDIVCSACLSFPKAGFGLVLGATIGVLISSIPVLGIVLGPIVTPVSVALGLLWGTFEDLKDNALKRRISEIQASFSPLGA